ncbi:uncharacterized protein LOC123518723 [Portunus trituberculatus]|uniref:uncharacterized protein LOC123518723 n=1 Tax=Portunus trituberculatus TaxID=210409 RepID=UPI001E1CFF76|nr:uncharacterized protein LOC123518723 [Portunus trituberculatus]
MRLYNGYSYHDIPQVVYGCLVEQGEDAWHLQVPACDFLHSLTQLLTSRVNHFLDPHTRPGTGEVVSARSSGVNSPSNLTRVSCCSPHSQTGAHTDSHLQDLLGEGCHPQPFSGVGQELLLGSTVHEEDDGDEFILLGLHQVLPGGVEPCFGFTKEVSDHVPSHPESIHHSHRSHNPFSQHPPGTPTSSASPTQPILTARDIKRHPHLSDCETDTDDNLHPRQATTRASNLMVTRVPLLAPTLSLLGNVRGELMMNDTKLHRGTQRRLAAARGLADRSGSPLAEVITG